MTDGATFGRRACACLAVALGACIPGVLGVQPEGGSEGPDGQVLAEGSTDGPATGQEASTDTSTAADASGKPDSGGPTDSGAMDMAVADANDAGSPLEAGFMRCLGTMSSSCDLAGGDECCDSVYGDYAADGGVVYSLTQATCEAIGGANCGSFESIGNNFSFSFPQTCSSAADCTGGDVCCIAVREGGAGFDGIDQVACVPPSSCASTDRQICTTSGACTGVMQCVTEMDPILSHLTAKDCQ